jgi:hypothetical protein
MMKRGKSWKEVGKECGEKEETGQFHSIERYKTKKIREEEHFKISAAEVTFPVLVIQLFVAINKIIFDRSLIFRNISICIKECCEMSCH